MIVTIGDPLSTLLFYQEALRVFIHLDSVSNSFKKSHNYMQLKIHLRFIESTRGDDSSRGNIRFSKEIFVIRDGSNNMMIF